MMSDPTHRALQLLALLQTHRFWRGEELAERLGVTTRTVRRDIDRLRDLGYPVAAIAGMAGGYRLEAGRELPPLLLDDEEAVAIAVGLRTAASGSLIGVEEIAVRALAKLEQVLPARLRRRVEAVHTATVVLPSGPATVDAETLAVLTLACRDRERLRFRYRRRDGDTARRDVEPHRLVNAGRRWYLLGWDLARADWRTFRVDRLDEVALTGVRFPERPLPSEDVAAFVREAIRAPFTTHRAVVRFDAPAGVVGERLWTGAGEVEPDGAETCLLRTEADSLDWIAFVVAHLDLPFTVVEPDTLAQRLRVLAERFSTAAG